MKNIITCFLVSISLIGVLSCDTFKKEPIPVEKLIFSEIDLGKCKCINNPAPVCYFDTVKTYLMILNDVTGTIESIDNKQIRIDDASKYILGPSEIYTDKFYFWKLFNGYTYSCNFPSVLLKEKYNGAKVKISCKVDIIPTPRSPSEHPGEYLITLTKLEILK